MILNRNRAIQVLICKKTITNSELQKKGNCSARLEKNVQNTSTPFPSRAWSTSRSLTLFNQSIRPLRPSVSRSDSFPHNHFHAIVTLFTRFLSNQQWVRSQDSESSLIQIPINSNQLLPCVSSFYIARISQFTSLSAGLGCNYRQLCQLRCNNLARHAHLGWIDHCVVEQLLPNFFYNITPLFIIKWPENSMKLWTGEKWRSMSNNKGMIINEKQSIAKRKQKTMKTEQSTWKVSSSRR